MMDVDFLPPASRGARRQLHRARVRPDVPPLRQRGHGRRDGAAPDRARGRGRLRRRSPAILGARGHRHPHSTPSCLQVSPKRRRRSPCRSRLRAGPRSRSWAPTCCWPSAGGPTPTTSGSTAPASKQRQARLHRGRRPAAHQRARHLGAGRLQRPRRLHPHRLQRLRDRRRQPSRRRAPARQRPHCRLRALHRSAARPRRHDRGRGAQERPPRAGRPASPWRTSRAPSRRARPRAS